MYKDEARLRAELSHECELSAQEDITVKYIKTGMFVTLRRRLRQNFLPSFYNYQTVQVIRSIYMINKEREQQLKHYYHTIHPFSVFRLWWEMFMAVVWLAYCSIVLIAMTFKVYVEWNYTLFALDVICWIDMGLSFNTGYHNKQLCQVILKRKKLIRHYMTTWFAIDLFSSLHRGAHVTSFTNNYNQYFCYLKFLRLLTVWKYLDHYREMFNFDVNRFLIFKMLLIFTNIVNVVTHLHVMEKRDGNFNYLTCSYRAIYSLLLFGSSETSTTYMRTIIIDCIIFNIGFCTKLWIIGHLLETVMKYSSFQTKYYTQMQQIEEYMHYKNLPRRIKKRVLEFFNFRFQENYYKEDEMLNLLSPQLKQEMVFHIYMPNVEKVSLLQDLPPHILAKIIYDMKLVVFMPSEVIVSAGSIGDAMYIIGSGAVAVYTSTGREICHLTDGANFGEISLLASNEQRVATVVAIDCCELYVLHRTDFNKQMERFPEVHFRLRKIAQDRMRRTMIDETSESSPSLMMPSFDGQTKHTPEEKRIYQI